MAWTPSSHTPLSRHRQERPLRPGLNGQFLSVYGQFPKKLYPGPGPSLTSVCVQVPSASLC